MNLEGVFKGAAARTTKKRARRARAKAPPVKPRVERLEPGYLVVVLDGMRLKNPSNGNQGRGHFAIARERKAQHDVVYLVAELLAKAGVIRLRGTGWRNIGTRRKDGSVGLRVVPDAELAVARVAIRLVRVGPGRLDGWDNLRSCFKAVRDALTLCVGERDDESARLVWDEPAQERARTWAVRIEVRALPAGG